MKQMGKLNLCHVLIIIWIYAVFMHSAVNESAITFLGVIERLYTFFFSSNDWWEVLSLHVKVMMKPVEVHATKLFKQWKTGFQGVIKVLDSLTSASENLQMRGDTQIILLSIENFSFMSHLFNWEEILGQINLIQKKLQETGIPEFLARIDLCCSPLRKRQQQKQ